MSSLDPEDLIQWVSKHLSLSRTDANESRYNMAKITDMPVEILREIAFHVCCSTEVNDKDQTNRISMLFQALPAFKPIIGGMAIITTKTFKGHDDGSWPPTTHFFDTEHSKWLHPRYTEQTNDSHLLRLQKGTGMGINTNASKYWTKIEEIFLLDLNWTEVETAARHYYYASGQAEADEKRLRQELMRIRGLL